MIGRSDSEQPRETSRALSSLGGFFDSLEDSLAQNDSFWLMAPLLATGYWVCCGAAYSSSLNEMAARNPARVLKPTALAFPR